MRQIMPHRNNIDLQRIKCKIFLSVAAEMAASATFLPQRSGAPDSMTAVKFLMSNNGLHVLQFVRDAPCSHHSDIADMQIMHDKIVPRFAPVLRGRRDDGGRFRRLRRPTRASFERRDSPVLPQFDRRGGQVARRRVRSRDRGRPRRRGGDAPVDLADVSGPWRDRRGIWRRIGPTRNMSGCSIRSTAPRASFPACRPGAR